MIKKRLLWILIMVPLFSEAQNNGCAAVGSSMEVALLNTVARDLQIDTSTILRNKTTVNVIDTASVSRLYAKSLAKMDFESAKSQGKATIPENAYFESYYENHTQSVTSKYIYINKEMKKDIFIASSLINKDECSVRFNGYITLSREF